MLQQLNQYLFQFRALALPQFGTIRLIAHPARLDVVEHLVYPPAYQPQFTTDDKLSEHQLEYFAASLQQDAAFVEAYLAKAGAAIKDHLQAGVFNWGGVGTFEFTNHQIRFNPQSTGSLAPVHAQRVIRENVQHAVLQGDQVVMTDTGTERVVEESRTKDYLKIAAWVLAVLALLFIVYYLYQHQFSPQASGTSIQLQPAAPAPTWQ